MNNEEIIFPPEPIKLGTIKEPEFYLPFPYSDFFTFKGAPVITEEYYPTKVSNEAKFGFGFSSFIPSHVRKYESENDLK